MTTIKYVLSIYSWIAIGMLLVFVGRIAYFYEKTSGQHVGYWVLIAPAALLIAGAIWYLARSPAFIQDATGNLLLFAGGTLLIAFGAYLRRLMTGE